MKLLLLALICIYAIDPSKGTDCYICRSDGRISAKCSNFDKYKDTPTYKQKECSYCGIEFVPGSNNKQVKEAMCFDGYEKAPTQFGCGITAFNLCYCNTSLCNRDEATTRKKSGQAARVGADDPDSKNGGVGLSPVAAVPLILSCIYLQTLF